MCEFFRKPISTYSLYGKKAGKKHLGLAVMYVWKTAEMVNLKNRDLDLIWSILLKCGYFRFMICFWIFPKKHTLSLNTAALSNSYTSPVELHPIQVRYVSTLTNVAWSEPIQKVTVCKLHTGCTWSFSGYISCCNPSSLCFEFDGT